MIRYLAVAACASCAAVLLSALAPVAEAHEGLSRCGIKRSHTDQVTPYVEVVEKYYEDGDSDEVRVWACLRVGPGDSRRAQRRGYRKRRLLGKVDCFESCTWETVVATGFGASHAPRSRVAFTEGGCSRYSAYCATRIRVIDLTTGQVALSGFSGTSAAPRGFDITATGTAVWLAGTDECSFNPPECTEIVRGLTYKGQTLAFDEGPDLSEMALVGNRLYWMRGDEPQTADVP